jgi:hypothetical protein
VVSIGVGRGLIVEVETGVGGTAVPGQIEILTNDGPGGDGVPQGTSGIPPTPVTHGVDELPPPQLHEKTAASTIIAAPTRIHRAELIIGIQL